MSFLKSFFGALLALIVFCILLVVFCVACFMPKVETVEPNSVLCISLSGSIEERPEPDFYSAYFDKENISQSLESILHAIHSAKMDDCIRGIYLKPGAIHTGYGTLEEIRKALLDFKQSGKFIISYSGSYSQGAYYVASVADSIFLNPQGILDFRGVSSSSMFYKHLLDTLDVEMQVIKVGTYKSFTEQYTNDSMSVPNREQVGQMVNGLWKSVLKDISLSRSIPTSELDKIASDMMSFRMPQEALNCRLVDKLCYADQVRNTLQHLLSLDASSSVNFVSVENYVSSEKMLNEIAKESSHIAVFYACGEIDNGNTDGISSSKVCSELHKLEEDDNVKAVVVRVNSPGGSAYGAEQIWRSIELLKNKKPVVVSMGDYAASGGYYLSSGAHQIFSEEKTLTGSIGVFSVIPNVQGLMNKIGVTQEVVKTNPYADLLSNITRPLDDYEKQILQTHVEEVYNVFIQRCSKGRSISKTEIEKIAEGRVWTGYDALKNGLVDQIGTLQDAIRYASALVGLGDSPQIVSYPEQKDWMSSLEELPHIGYEKFIHNDIMSREKRILYRLQNLDCDQAILPYSIEFR